MKKNLKISLIALIIIVLLIAGIVVGIIYKLNNNKPTQIIRMSITSEEKTFGNITVTVLPEIVGTWYESSTYNSQGENDHKLTIESANTDFIIGTVCLESNTYITDIKATKESEGIYTIESNKYTRILEGKIEIKEKAIELTVEKVGDDASEDVKDLKGKTITFDYKDQKIFEYIFSTTAGYIGVTTDCEDDIKKYEIKDIENEYYTQSKNEIIKILKAAVTSTYTVYGGTFTEQKEVEIFEKYSDYNVITIDCSDIFISDDENNPIIVFYMSGDRIYYVIIDVTDKLEVREGLNKFINNYINKCKEADSTIKEGENVDKKNIIQIPQNPIIRKVENIEEVTPVENNQTIKDSEKVNEEKIVETPQNKNINVAACYAVKIVYYDNGSIEFLNYKVNDNSKIDGYNFYRSTSENGTYNLIGTTTKDTYIINGIDRSIPYYYKVKAYKIIDGIKYEGEFACEEPQYVPAEITEKPTDLYFTSTYDYGMKVTFNSIKGANKYYAISSEDINGTYTYENNSNTNSITNIVWTSNERYHKVYAANIAGNGQYEVYGPKSDAIYIPSHFEEKATLKIITTITSYLNNSDRMSYSYERKINTINGADGYILWSDYEPKIDVKAADATNSKFKQHYSYIQPYKKGENYLLYGAISKETKNNETIRQIEK